MPLRDRPNSSDDRLDIQCSACQQSNHPLPNRPIMAETSLKTHIFLHDRVDRKIQWLRSPAYFGDLPVWPHQLHRGLECNAVSRCIHHYICSESIPLFSPSFSSIFSDQRITAVSILGDFQSTSIRFQTQHRHFRPTKSSYSSAENPDRSRTDHDYPISGFDV